ncbi:MAG: DUF4040 domain-containing protein [Proteobacteria bacterium]|nr:DUF4040 domain-containing protein [Pseudomonadota bacterium]
MLLYELSIALTLTLMLITAAFSLHYRYLVVCVTVSGIYSLSTVLLFVLLDAVDVAFTEAAVGGGFSLILFLCALALVRRDEDAFLIAPLDRRWLPALMSMAFVALMIYGTAPLPEVGDPNAPAQLHVAPHYLWQSMGEIGVPNVVTSVLASYRGYDTLGETAVVFCSALGVVGLLSPTRRPAKADDAA